MKCSQGEWLLELFHAMPKAEVHVHLDGAMGVKTALDLDFASFEGLAGTAAGNPEGMGGGISGLSFQKAHERLVVSRNLDSQEALLKYYDAPIALLQSERALERVTEELILAKAADNVRYLEIRWAPGLHLRGGLSLMQVVGSVVLGKRRACAKTGVNAKLIAAVLRSDSVKDNLELLEQIHEANLYYSTGAGREPMGASGFVALGGGTEGSFCGGETCARGSSEADEIGLGCREDATSAFWEISAVDLAGLERKWPNPLEQRAFFDRARELGYFITLHCGEIPRSASIIRRVVEEIAPDRLAHGAGAYEDAELCAVLAARGVQLDLCPTSNIQSRIFDDYRGFPIKELLNLGVAVSVSTDSPVISGKTLGEEYYALADSGAASPAELWGMNLASLARLFAPASLKRRLFREFEYWARDVEELRL